MISYSRESQETIPSSSVKIVGLGGAGANMLERIALDGIEGAELLALNTDVRTLDACLAKDKIQLGVNLTKGLGTGGDPELGQQAVLEAENTIREALKGQRIVFLCTGLGGGTGSGAAPIVSRIAREEGAFVVVFATMPFFFEGRRRREQAETSLNELAVLSNALVTFDNNRMGELVLAKQGIHEAFAAADRMISESIKAVIRLVVRPGLINVGLDDLMSALRTTRSRCLFGSGIADGKDRASKALRNALSSPLLDQGSLLKEAQTVLVHLSGGESLTLFEIELLMRSLQKHVPENAHVLFGAAIDPAMGDKLSITLISALPEDALAAGARDSISFPEAAPEATARISQKKEIENPFIKIDRKEKPAPEAAVALPGLGIGEDAQAAPAPKPSGRPTPEPSPGNDSHIGAASLFDDPAPEPEPEERPFAEFVVAKPPVEVAAEEVQEEESAAEEQEESPPESEPEEPVAIVKPVLTQERPERKPFWTKPKTPEENRDEDGTTPADAEPERKPEPRAKSPLAELKLDPKHSAGQSELAFDSAPRGRFEGENPNVVDGEDLDLPPFLRKKKS